MHTLSNLLHNDTLLLVVIIATNLFNGASWLISYKRASKQSAIIDQLMEGLVLYKEKLEEDYDFEELDIPPPE